MDLSDSQPLDLTYEQFQSKGRTLIGLTIDKYSILREIGKGAFGSVYLAQDKQGQMFAVKLLDLQELEKEQNPKVKEIRWRLVKSEPRLMQLCNSPNVLKCFNIFENKSMKVMILEYCNGKTLEDYVYDKRFLRQGEAVMILRQIINGLAELHRNKIVHRDLKAENVMEHEGIYKIIDLGFSKKLQIANFKDQVKNTTLGTMTTMAPEVMMKRNYGLKADIWSLGCIFFQMVFGTQLYDSNNARKRLQQIEKKKYFRPNQPLTFNGITISRDANNFLYSVLEVDTNKRLDWQEVLEHPLIKEKPQDPIPQRFMVAQQLMAPVVDRLLEDNQMRPSQVSHGNLLDESFSNSSEEKRPTFSMKKQQSSTERWKIEEQLQRQRHIQRRSYPRKAQEDSEQYRWVKETHLECLKTQLLYQEVIRPIQEHNIFDMNDRQTIELMYLLSVRGFNNMSPISDRIEKGKKSERLVDNLHSQVKSLYEKVKREFLQYGQKLTAIENQWSEMFVDFFRKRLSRKSFQEKNNYTSGIEEPDMGEKNENVQRVGSYSKEEQIEYTIDRYITPMLGKMKGNGKNVEKVRRRLQNYKKLMLVELGDLKEKNVEIDYEDFVTRTLV